MSRMPWEIPADVASHEWSTNTPDPTCKHCGMTRLRVAFFGGACGRRLPGGEQPDPTTTIITEEAAMTTERTPADTHRVVRCGDQDRIVQTRPVTAEFALEHADLDGIYTGYIFVRPDFYSDVLDAADGVDALSDQLAAALHDDLEPAGLAEIIVGFDHDSQMLVMRVSNNVVEASSMGR